jgi:4-amino-4-deoxy-L-arabinose transferase-like glycosyltransferase
VNPTFIFWSRQGVFVTSAVAGIGLGVVLTWLRWWRTGARRYAIAGAFLMGLGLYTKLLFLWLIVGLGLATILVNVDQWQRVRRRILRGPVGWTGLAFLLGSSPLIVYNLQTGGTFDTIGTNLITSYYGTNNLAFLPNLLERLRQFAAVLTGSHFWYMGEAYANWLNLGLFLAALSIALFLGLGAAQREDRLAVFPFAVIGGVILASCATVSALWVTHFALLSPWPALGVAAAVGLLVRRIGLQVNGRGANWILVLMLAVISASWLAEVVTDVRYHRALAISGGLGAHSDAVEDLASWLAADERRGVPVVAMDWGIAASVAFLTQGEVTPVEAFGYDWETDAEFAARLEPFIDDPGSIYLWRSPEEIIFDRSDDFRKLFQARGLEEDILEAFYERSGRPVLGATRLVPEGTAANPPAPLDGD